MFNNQFYYKETSDYNHLYGNNQNWNANLQPLVPPVTLQPNWTPPSSASFCPPLPEVQPYWADLKIKHEKIDQEEATHFNNLNANLPTPEPDQPAGLAYLPGDQFDPSTKSFTHDELRPAPIVRKRKKVLQSNDYVTVNNVTNYRELYRNT